MNNEMSIINNANSYTVEMNTCIYNVHSAYAENVGTAFLFFWKIRNSGGGDMSMMNRGCGNAYMPDWPLTYLLLLTFGKKYYQDFLYFCNAPS